MKKKLFMGTLLLLVCFILFGCKSKYISKAEAQELVLNDSHRDRDSVVFTQIELDRKKWIYEIEFTADGTYEYEYQVDAKKWEIIIDDDIIIYSRKDAIEIAVVDAGYTVDEVEVLSTEQDKKSWETYYEIEFIGSWDYKYEYEISANDWRIISSEKLIIKINN